MSEDDKIETEDTPRQLRLELEALRRQAEGARHLQQLADAVPAYISYVDRGHRYTMVNRNYVEQFQREPDQFVGFPVREVLGPQNYEKVRSNLDAALAGQSVRAQIVSEIPSSGTRYLDMTYTPDRRDDGSIAGCFVLGIDITDQRLAEEKLQREVVRREAVQSSLELSESRFRALADSMPQLVWMADENGTVTYYNSRTTTYDGFAKEDSDKWEWSSAVHPAEREQTAQAWRKAVESHEAYQCEHRVRMADGSYRWHLSRAHYDGIGRWFGTATDIHEVKEAQEALHESDRLKDEFLAMLGHELRNPLATIRTAIDVLELIQGEDPRARDAHGALDRQSRHMARLVDGLLEVSRITMGKISLQPQPLDLRALMARALDDHRARISARGLTTTTEFPAEPLWVEGDEVRLSQVLGNLLGNAIKFTAPPGTIEVSASRQDGSALIRIRDTGVGIDPDALSHVFEPFKQEATDIARAGGGLGLGLALVRGLVELHHGSVEARSEGRDKGSEFRIVLPLSEGVQAPTHTAVGGAKARRVLIVEDNIDAAEMMQLLLELQGHEVTVVDEGVKALATLRESGADVVLCDIGLPGMSGYDIARAVRADATIVPPKLVAVTGYGQSDDVKAAQDAGFDQHLVKPVDLESLRAVLARV